MKISVPDSIQSSAHAVRTAKASDCVALKFVDPLLRADPDRADMVRAAVDAGACLVAVDGDEVLGYILVNGDLLGHRLISLLVVAIGGRRQGVGQALLKEACRRCDRPKLFVSCNRSNVPAQALFDKCGFQPSGYVGNLDEGDEELFYFKALNNAPPAGRTPPRFE